MSKNITAQDLMTEIKAVRELAEKLLAKIEKVQSAPKATAPASSGDVAGPELLSRDWADMEIRRDPPRWAGPSHVGKRMSQCPADYLLAYASFYDWKASKGREEDPPRLNSKGKPWFESDELTAKIARGWAAREKPVAPAPAEDLPF